MENQEGIDIANGPLTPEGAQQYRMMDAQIARHPLVPAQIPQAVPVAAANPLASLFDFSTIWPWLILGGAALAIYLMMEDAPKPRRHRKRARNPFAASEEESDE